MRIQEHACESKICLSKFQFNCDEVDSSVPKPLPQNLNHFMLIVGKPGSSKTTLLLTRIDCKGPYTPPPSNLAKDSRNIITYINVIDIP